MATLQRAFDQGFDAVKKYIDRSFEQFEKRIAQLEAKQTAVEYRGTWLTDVKYSKGSLATHAGSMWSAEQDTLSKPGTDATWRLCVKNGTFSK
jgi:hypothetical protein